MNDSLETFWTEVRFSAKDIARALCGEWNPCRDCAEEAERLVAVIKELREE